MGGMSDVIFILVSKINAKGRKLLDKVKHLQERE